MVISPSKRAIISLSRVAIGFSQRCYISTSIKNNHEKDFTEISPRRSIFYVPAADERKLKSSLKSTADCVVYDLEDSVATGRKNSARENVLNVLEASEHGRVEKAVRINAVGSGFEVDDLNIVLRSNRLQCIVIPKVKSAKEVQFVSNMVDTVAPDITRKNVTLMACVESALAIMQLREIATSDPRLTALVFAAEDYAADVGLIRTKSRKELLFARSAVVTASKAYGLQAIDLVCTDYKDMEILREECLDGRQMGFDGKQAIHPSQVDIIQNEFMPNQNEITRAVLILNGYADAVKQGKGAYSLEGEGSTKMIDLPVVKSALSVITKAQAAGMKLPPISDLEATREATTGR